MKRLLHLLLSTALCTMFFACENPSNEINDPKDDPIEEPTEQTDGLEVKIVETKTDDIIINVNVNKYEGNYYVGTYPYDSYIELLGDDPEELANQLVAAELNKFLTDFSVVDNKSIFDKSIENYSFSDYGWIFKPSTKYAICVFGVEGELGDLSSDVVLVEATTLSLEQKSDFKLDFEVVSEARSTVEVKYIPNQDDVEYFYGIYIKEDFDNYKEDEFELMTTLLERTANAKGYLINGEQVIPFGGLDPLTEYVVVGFGVSAMTPITNIFYEPVTTTNDSPGVDSGINLDLSIKSNEQNEVVVAIDPKDYDGNYYVGLTEKSIYESECNSNPDELAVYLINEEINNYMTALTNPDGYVIFTGAQDAIHIEEAWRINPGVDYVLSVFGIVGPNGVIVTEVATEEFRSHELERMDDFTVNISTANITYHTATLSYKPSDESATYFNTILYKEAIDNFEGSEQELMESIIYTYSEVLDYRIQKGIQGMNYTALEAESDYVAVAFAVAGNTPISHLSKYEFSTPAPGVQPEGIGIKIDMEVVETASENVFVKVDPKDYKGNYYVGSCPMEAYTRDYGSDPLTIAQAFVDLEVNSYLTDFSYVDEIFIFNGKQDRIDTGKGWTHYTPSSEFVLFTFGVEGMYGGIVTDVTLVSTMTLTSGGQGGFEVPDIDFGSIEVSNITDKSYDCTFKPTDPDMTYVVMTLPTDYYDDYFTSSTQWILDDVKAFETHANGAGVSIEQYMDSIMKSGEMTLTIEEYYGTTLAANNKYTTYVYGFSTETMCPTSEISKAEVTTAGSAAAPARIPYAPTLNLRNSTQSNVQSSKGAALSSANKNFVINKLNHRNIR